LNRSLKGEKLLSALFIIVMAASFAAFIPKTFAIPGTGMYIDPPTVLGQEFTIQVRAANFTKLFLVGGSLKWNSTVLNMTSYAWGDMGWGAGIKMDPIIDYVAGKAEGFGWTSTGPDSTVSGSNYKVFFSATFRFVAFTNSSTKIDLYDCVMKDTYGTDIIPPYSNSPYDCFAKLIETIAHPISVPPYTFTVITVSNSSVSPVQFNQPAMKIYFNVTGPTGTKGFCNVTIPRGLLDCTNIGDWIILLAGTPITGNCIITRDATNTYISIPYNHSTKEIDVFGKWVVPEFSSTMTLLTLLLASLVVILLSKKQLMKRKT
jgi:hypothetical protein